MPVTAVGYAREAMASDWRAAMTFLERTDPEHWSRRGRVDFAQLPSRPP